MADLPKHRVTYARPFSRIGIDYAGPIMIRLRHGRKPTYIKAYICLFVCLTVKAVHLELASDLSTAAFLAALDRFCARRGKPSDIFSDNGTNFVGANRQLNEMFQLALSNEYNKVAAEHLSKNNIAWHFNPPSSPHFGGLWEAGVKLVKTHLKRVIGDNILTYEELYTLLTNIEAVINSRPLVANYDDDQNCALTPAHFLIGQPLVAIPKPLITDQKISLLNNWQLLQNLSQRFWKTWSNDYLTSLQQRPKWASKAINLKQNDIVVLRDNTTPPTAWLIGRVIECYPGKDNQVRVVKVKTTQGVYIRPAVNVVPLPNAEEL